MTKIVKKAEGGSITVECDRCNEAHVVITMSDLEKYILGSVPSYRGLPGVHCDPCRAIIDALSPKQLADAVTADAVSKVLSK